MGKAADQVCLFWLRNGWTIDNLNILKPVVVGPPIHHSGANWNFLRCLEPLARLPLEYDNGGVVSGITTTGVEEVEHPLNTFGGFHSHGGTPRAGWFLLGKITENPKQKWMMTRGTPISGNPHL